MRTGLPTTPKLMLRERPAKKAEKVVEEAQQQDDFDIDF